MKQKLLTLLGRYGFPVLIVLSSIDEVIREKEMEDKMDDFVYLGIALVALIVGIFVKGKVQKWISLVFFAAATLTKIIALFIEHDDFTAVDHDYVILAFMALWVIVSFVWKRKHAV